MRHRTSCVLCAWAKARARPGCKAEVCDQCFSVKGWSQVRNLGELRDSLCQSPGLREVFLSP